MTYIGYENLETGRFSLVQTNIDLKDFCNTLRNEILKFKTSEMIGDLIYLMEDEKNRKNSDVVLFMLGIMAKNYLDSNVEFGNENFYWLRTNGKRFHTIGKKLWKGAKKEDVEKFFKKNLRKDYDHVYQNW